MNNVLAVNSHIASSNAHLVSSSHEFIQTNATHHDVHLRIRRALYPTRLSDAKQQPRHVAGNAYTNAIPGVSTLQLPRRHDRYNASSFTEPRPEHAICVLKHTVLQTDDDELRTLEARLDDPANVLCMGQIKRRVDFIQDVHRRRLELQESEDEGEGDE